MRTLALGLAALVALGGLAGCTTSRSSGYGTSTGPWQTADGPLWLAYSHGCGFCSGDPDAPQYKLVALYRDGSILAIDYAPGKGGFNMTQPWLAPYRTAVEALFQQARAYGAYNEDAGTARGVRVLGVATARLAADPMASVEASLQHALRLARDPTGHIDRTDCGPAIIESFGKPRADRVGVGCGLVGGNGWSRVEREMKSLEVWARAEAPKTLVAPRGLAPAHGADGGVEPAPVRAAFVARTCGGIAFGCSGATGIVVYESGTMIAFWGEAWGAASQGTTACGAHRQELEALAVHGDAWTIPCGASNDIPTARGATSAAAWPELDVVLAGITLASPPPPDTCCDRIFSEVHLLLGDQEGSFAYEGDDAALPEGPARRLYYQLDTLHTWIRPSA
jgi:hypothetical protein